MKHINTIEDLLWAEKIGQWRAEERAEYRRRRYEEGRAEARCTFLSRLQESGMITADQAATAMVWSF
ncbi:MAG: hypothetical protein IJ587_01085 [Synergistaceae bacterium]|nr:hypothetical protein [Synergistaceae bacterium]